MRKNRRDKSHKHPRKLRLREFQPLEPRHLLANWSGDIPNGTVWSNSEVQSITGNASIAAGHTLTIQPGTVIQFNAGTNLTVDGTLKAQGTAAAPVTFTSYQDASPLGGANHANPGDWGAITFNAGSGASSLDDVVIRYGGGDSQPGEFVIGAAVAVDNSTVSNSYGTGMRIVGSSPTLANDIWQNNNGSAISMDLASSPVITTPAVQGNGTNADVVDAGSISGSVKWNNPQIAYRVFDKIAVPTGASLEVDAGQVVQLGGYFFGQDPAISVSGTLDVAGSAAAPVTFTSSGDNSPLGGTNNAHPGDWDAIAFNAGSGASTLNHAVIKYGGGYSEPAQVLDSSNITVSNSTISNAYSSGLRITASNPTLTADSFVNNGGAALSADLTSQPVITGEMPASISGNGINGMTLDSGTITANTTWNAANVVYCPAEGKTTVAQGVTLTIAPGIVVKPQTNGAVFDELEVDGKLVAQGTAAAPIVFTSFFDGSAGGDTNHGGVLGPGEGYCFLLTATSSANVMDHVEIRYAFVTGPQLGTIEDHSALTLSNSVIRNNGGEGAGVLVATGGTATLTDNLIVYDFSGIEAQAGSTMTAVNNTIDSPSFWCATIASPNVTLTNNLLTNAGDARGGGINEITPGATISSNDVYNTVGPNYNGLPDQTGTNGNISADPKYFNRANLQYELHPGSPAEDAGTSAGAPATDILGNPRFKDPNIVGRGDGSGYDMGAFEVQQTATSNVDLTVANVSGPATGVEGQSVTVSWTDQSVGAGTAAGPWHDAVYLSASPVFTPDAILLGEVEHYGSLGPGQSDSISQSGTFTLPGVVPGNYYLIVRTNSRNEIFEGSNLANNAVASTAAIAMDLPAVTLGTPTTGNLAATGAVQLYKVTTTAASDLNVTLSGLDGNANELYVSFGDVPSRQSFLARGVRAGSANQSVSLANAQAGTYYVMVYGASIPAAERFTLTANTLGFSLTGVSPAHGSNTGQATITITGAQFDANSRPQLVDSAGATIKPASVYYTDSGLISATFDLTGHPAGPADVQVVNSGGATQTLPHGFNIIAGQPGRLVTSLSAPSAVRLGREFQVTIDYTNAGDADLLAPVMHLSVTNPGELSFTTDMTGAATGLDLIAVNPNGPAGVLPPGAHGSITVYGASTGAGTPTFQLTQASYPATPIDWADAGPLIRPGTEDFTDAQWATVFAQIQKDIGNTWDAYQKAISADATLLPAGRGNNYSLRDVFEIEYDQAIVAAFPSVTGRLFLNDTAHPLGNVAIKFVDPSTAAGFDAVTSNDGSFVIREAIAGSFNVTAGGFAPPSVSSLAITSAGVSGLQLIVAPGGAISGAVILPDGTPLRNAAVSAIGVNGGTGIAMTDVNGKYTIDSLPADAYSVAAGSAPDTHTIVDNVVVGAGQLAPNVVLTVQQGGTIGGTVTGPSGAVAGAAVSALGADGNLGTATTGQDGSYTIAGLAPQSYSVTAAVAGLAPGPAVSVKLNPQGSVSGVNVSVVASGAIHVRVTSAASGNPLASTTLSITSHGVSQGAITDAQGQATIPSLPPGSYTVATTDGTSQQMTVSGQAVVTAGATAQLALATDALGQVSGVVSNSVNGSPVSNVVVYAANTQGIVSETTTDSTGKYTLANFDAGTYQVVLGDDVSPGLSTVQVTFSPGHASATANFTLGLAGMLSGTVYQADGSTPIPNANVSLEQNGAVILTMTADDNGHYVFDVVAAGTYRLEAGNEGFAFPVLSNVVVGGGAVQSGLNFVAGKGVIEGLVEDAATGQPLTNALVSIERTDSGVLQGLAALVAVGTDGSFTFSGAVPGTYLVTATNQGHAFAAQTVTVSAAGPATTNFKLMVENVLQGTIRDAGSAAPIAGATVILSTSSDFTGSAVSDRAGHYQFSRLPAGAFSLMVRASGYQTIVARDEAITQPNQVLDETLLPSSTTVHGTVRSAGVPLSQTTVTAIDSGDFVVASTTTTQNGQYSFTALAPGAYSLVASASDYQPSTPLPITVAANQALAVPDITLTAAALADFQLNPDFQALVSQIDESGSGLLQNLPPSYSLPLPFELSSADTDKLFATTGVDADCQTKQQTAQFFYALYQVQLSNANIAYAVLPDRLSTLQNDLTSAETLVKQMAGILQAINELTPVLVAGDLKAQALLKIAQLFLPKIADVQYISAGLSVAKQNLYGIGTAGPTNTSLPNALAALSLLLEPTANGADSRVLQLVEDANFQSALFAKLIGADSSKYVPLRGSILFGPKEVLDQVDSFLHNPQSGFEPPDLGQFTDRVKLLLDLPAATMSELSDALAKVNSDVSDVNTNLHAISLLGFASNAFKLAFDEFQGCSCQSSASPSTALLSAALFTAPTFATCTNDSTDVLGQSQDPTLTSPSPAAAPVNEDGPSTTVGVHVPVDPNDLIGPAGFGSQGFIQPGTMPYRADFENDPAKATAAAQVVTATLTLDPNLDPTTFQFTGFGFGSHDFTVPAGLQHYSTTIDLRPDGVNLLVPATLDFNQATGVVNVSFQSLDPLTMQPPDGINAGFLPIDDANHDGEGYFTFSAQPKPGLPTGTAISEQASIVFDTNAPLSTPTATNTLDVGPPNSSVAAHAAMSPASFTVNWSGTDDAGGSGVAFYDVYVSDNGGPFTPFQTATTQTSATFSGTVGHTYGFYSVATDNVGHRQATPTGAQTTTTVSTATVLLTSSVAALPATESATSFTVSWSGSDAGGPGIAKFDVFVSDNRGLFTPFQTATTQTSATFDGLNGHTYGFYSVAIDTAGNRQPTPAAAQASTTVAMVTALPTSSVAALVAASPASFTVSWSGSDPGGPGIASYDVFVSDNGGPFTALVKSTTTTSAVFNGVNGHTYGFYSVAIDTAGNRQATPTSAQATTMVAADPNERYVVAVYHDVLGRAPDSGGQAFWTQSLDSGTAVAGVAEAIAHSDEYYANFVIRPAYLKLLGRAADDGGVTYWTDKMDGGATDQQLEADLVSAPEFYANAGGTNTLWIDAVYKLLLGRAPDAGGENYWNSQLAAGQTLSQVAQGIAGSQENNTQLINEDYFHYLGRAADSGGLEYWLQQFAAGTTNEDVIAGFTGSPEYYNKHTS